MACKTVYLKDRSRSLLYDKLIDSFPKDKVKIPINAYHNVNSFSGDLLFNDKTIRDRNGEPLPLYPVINQVERVKTVTINGNQDIYNQVPYVKEPNGNEPVFINSSDSAKFDNDVITLTDKDKVITLTDLETTTEIEGAVYGTVSNSNFKNVSGQKKASDLNKVLGQKRITTLEFVQSDELNVISRRNKNTIEVDFDAYSGTTKLNSGRTLLLDILKHTDESVYSMLNNFTVHADIPLFVNLLNRFPAEETEMLQDEMMAGMLSTIADLHANHDIDANTNLFTMADINEDINRLRDYLAGVNNYHDLSNAEKDNIDSYIARVNNFYMNELFTSIELALLPPTARSVGTNTKNAFNIMNTLVTMLSNKNTLEYANTKLKSFKQKVTDNDVVERLRESHLPYILQKRQEMINLLRLAKNDLKFDKGAKAELFKNVEQLNARIEEYTSTEELGAFLESLYLTLINDISNIGIIEDMSNQLEALFLNKKPEDFTFEERRMFASHANLIRQFIAAYDEIANLESISTINMPEFGNIASKIKELETQIRGLDTRVYELKTSYGKIREKYIDLHLSTVRSDKDIKELRKMMEDSIDISWAGSRLDSLMDTGHIFAAQVKKNYTKHFNVKELYIKDKRAEFNNLMVKHFGNKASDDEFTKKTFERIVDDNGRIMSVDDESLYDEVRFLKREMEIQRNKGLKHKDYLDARNAYYDFVNTNFETPYIKEFYDTFDDDVIELHNTYSAEINQVKNKVIEDYGSYKPKYLTEEQKETLDAAYVKRREFLNSGTPEAEKLQEMYSQGSKYIKIISQDFFKDYDDVLNENDIERDNFLMRNTSNSPQFQSKLDSLYETLGKSDYNNKAGEIEKSILARVKDRDGIHDMTKLTDEDLRKLKIIAIFKQIKNKKLVFGDTLRVKNANYSFKAIKPEGLTFDNIEQIVALVDDTRVEGLFTSSYKEKVQGTYGAYNALDPKAHPMPSFKFESTKAKVNKDAELAVLTLDELVRRVKSDYYHALPENVRNDEAWIRKNTYIDADGDVRFINGWEVTLPKDTQIIDAPSDNLIPKSYYLNTTGVAPKWIKNEDEFEVYRDGLGKPTKRNADWDNLSSSEQAIATDLREFLNTLTRDNFVPMIEHGFVPAIQGDDIDNITTERKLLKEEERKVKIARENSKFEFFYNVYQDASGQQQYNIPLRGVNKINQIPYLNIRKRRVNESEDEYNTYTKDYLKTKYDYDIENIDNLYNELIEENRKRRETNRKNHRNSVSLNLNKTIPQFVENMADYTYIKDMEDDIQLSMAIIANENLIQTSKVGATKLIDKGKKLAEERFGLKNIGTYLTKKGEGSYLYNLMESDIRRNFYGRYEEPHKGDAILKAARGYLSILGMGFNAFSAFKNINTGLLMTSAEAAAGYHFTTKDYALGLKEWWLGTPSYITDAIAGGEESSTRTNALIKFFNIVDEQLENPYADDKSYGFYKHKKIRNISKTANRAAFFMQSKGEDMLQNSTLFAMLRSHRIQNGKILSFEEFLWEQSSDLIKTQIDIKDIGSGNKEVVDKLISNYKGNIETLRQEFDKLESANNMFIFENGDITFNPKYINAELKDGTWYKKVNGITTSTVLTQEEAMRDVYNEFAEFKIKVQGVNHKIHGIYNKADKGQIEETMFGQLLMQYKHWMRAGWVRRYGANGVWNMRADFNVRRNEWSRGSYKTLLHYLTSPLRSGALSEFDDKRGVSVAMGIMIKGFRNQVVNYKRYWYAMDR